ncbi:chaperone DnaJ protein [Trypanosoma theileri]|uniref:Chaperone DnaJ protein n=1 Tax=Trypanosoma theileri TaxID=67003 RepID=A0A1X0P626_9TRYP|nr:chaperone DnaJ protein [Trypanosoma theileri]ORC92281.1 chaperone DnaJ protein [Trypanosoma theileri]
MGDTSRIEWIIDNSDSYYEVLGLTKTASEKQIRQSYYKLAVQLHPDKNSDNEKAADAFRVVANAYNVLMDPQRRKAYDHGGVDGVSKFETLQSLSFSEVADVIVKLSVSVVLCAVARQTHAIELVLERYPWMEGFIQKTEEDEFAIHRRSERAMLRRVVRRRFALFLFLLISIILGHSVLQWFRKDTGEDLPMNSYQHLSRRRTDDVGATFLCNPTEDNLTGVGTNTTTTTTTTEKRRGVLVWRPSDVSEEHAKYLCSRWVREMCPQQRQLAWASRERYEPTATLRVNRTLKAPPSPNRAAKHKWTFKRWRPRFMESFSVKSPEELFVVSPLCEAFG